MKNMTLNMTLNRTHQNQWRILIDDLEVGCVTRQSNDTGYYEYTATAYPCEEHDGRSHYGDSIHDAVVPLFGTFGPQAVRMDVELEEDLR